jgi:hypothetical protein
MKRGGADGKVKEGSYLCDIYTTYHSRTSELGRLATSSDRDIMVE